MLHTATLDEMKNGDVTDAYFKRTMEVLTAKGIHRHVTAEITGGSLPPECALAVLAGIEEAASLLGGFSIDVDCMPEGTLCGPGEPVMSISGVYTDFCVLETAVLGLLCQASGVATKAARCKVLAGDRPVLSFGSRRMHPAIAPMIDRNAYIGGCDGFSLVKAADLVGIPASGTMPHSLILCVGSLAEAARMFDEVIDEAVLRIALIDTFDDEKFAAIEVAEALGHRLYGIRLDTPGSRRGDMRAIIEEVRWELNLRGYGHVRILVSGGLHEADIVRLNPVADAYGVGTAISNAPVVNFALDIVEIEGKPTTKRGKRSGRKQVLRCAHCRKRSTMPADAPAPKCDCGATLEALLRPLIRGGKIAAELPPAKDIRAYVLRQLEVERLW